MIQFPWLVLMNGTQSVFFILDRPASKWFTFVPNHLEGNLSFTKQPLELYLKKDLAKFLDNSR